MRIGQVFDALCVRRAAGVVKKARDPNLQRRQIERDISICKNFWRPE